MKHQHTLPSKIWTAPEVDPKEARALKLLGEAGLIGPLFKLSGAKTDPELIDKVLSSGMWAGLLKLIDIVEAKK